METTNFLLWAIIVLGGGGFAVFSMVNAFLKPVEEVPFPDSVIEQPSIPLSETALQGFVGAAGTYKAGDYRGAVEQFTQVLEQEPNCAEAFHNLGRAYANIGDNNKAVRSFLKASDAYDQQGTKAGIDSLKHDMERLKTL